MHSVALTANESNRDNTVVFNSITELTRAELASSDETKYSTKLSREFT